MSRPPRLHHLRDNKGERSPRRLFVYDTETAWQTEERIEIHQLRLWAGLLVIRHAGSRRDPEPTECWGRTAEELASAVDQAARTTATTWAYAHNHSVDLAASRLPLALLARGWDLGQHALASEAPWARLRKRNKRLRLADSFSWLPVSVERLGELLGFQKPELPANADDEETWLRRCRADVAIVAYALCRAMDEWDRLKLGYWSLTGPASGWNAMLHMTPTKRRRSYGEPGQQAGQDREGPAVAPVVIDPDPEARALEREAVYSGRRDVWRVGNLPPEQYADLDFRTAHLMIAASLPLPDRRNRHFSHLDLDDWHFGNPLVSMVARCRVRTESARYPLRTPGGILHPVGEFETVLAGPELREARDRGELLEVSEGYSYRLGNFMQPWARWCLEQLAEGNEAVDPMLAVMCKGWSRSVPGRWGMLTSREQANTPHPHLGWALEHAAFGWPPKRGVIVYMGGRRLEVMRDQEADDSFPAVLAVIQSWARVLQARLLDALGETAVVRVNTDSALVEVDRLLELARYRWQRLGPEPDLAPELIAGAREASEITRPLEARIKAVARGGRVLSAQHVEHAGRRAFAGVPASAEDLGGDRFRFWTWPKLAGQIERGDPRGYIRELRTVNLSGLRPLRWKFSDGCCEPVRATWRPETGTRLLPARQGELCRHGEPLSPSQHRFLSRLA